MSGHDFHENLPGYSPFQVLVDGCPECEQRAGFPDHGIGSLDTTQFGRAWKRARQWYLAGLGDAAQAELPMLEVLAAVQDQLQLSKLPLAALIEAQS